MRIRLLMIGKTRRPEMRAILDDYVKRICRSCPIEVTEVRDGVAAIQKLDADRAATVVLLDAGGKNLDSNGLAKWLGQLRDRGTRELIFLCGDADGVLMDLLAHPPYQASSPEHANLDFTHSAPLPLELTQLTGAICPGGDESYRPGLWIVLRDPHAKPGASLPSASQERVASIA